MDDVQDPGGDVWTACPPPRLATAGARVRRATTRFDATARRIEFGRGLLGAGEMVAEISHAAAICAAAALDAVLASSSPGLIGWKDADVEEMRAAMSRVRVEVEMTRWDLDKAHTIPPVTVVDAVNAVEEPLFDVEVALARAEQRRMRGRQ